MSSSLSAPATCSRCNGTGWVPLGAGSYDIDPCTCQEGSRRAQRIAATRIPRRYHHCTLDSFSSSTGGALVRAKHDVNEFTDAWSPGRKDGKGLLLIGPCGSGKTHLAVAVLLGIVDRKKPGKLLFSNFQDLIQEIQASFDSDEVPSKSELLRPLLEADLLVLDELGSQKPSMFVHDILYYVINTRYNDARTTIFTTNYSDDLQERIGERLRSRLYEMTDEIRLTGVRDFRKNKTI